jgi:hypothetical protein
MTQGLAGAADASRRRLHLTAFAIFWKPHALTPHRTERRTANAVPLNPVTNTARSKETEQAVGQRSMILAQLHAHARPIPQRPVSLTVIFADMPVVRSSRPQPQHLRPLRLRRLPVRGLAVSTGDASLYRSPPVERTEVRSEGKALPARALHAHPLFPLRQPNSTELAVDPTPGSPQCCVSRTSRSHTATTIQAVRGTRARRVRKPIAYQPPPKPLAGGAVCINTVYFSTA